MQERQQLGILCLQEQEQFVHWLNDGKNIRVFSVKKTGHGAISGKIGKRIVECTFAFSDRIWYTCEQVLDK